MIDSPKINEKALRVYPPDVFTLIPLDDMSKRPRDKRWQSRSYDTKKVVARSIAANSNVGVRLDETQLVLDIDPRNGGADGYLDLCLDLGLDDSPVHVVTGSGGAHYYFRIPPGTRVLNALKEFPGVEFKSVGRQVVAAGSIHPDTGKHYIWASPPDFAAMPYAPKALLDLITRPVSVEAVESGVYDAEQIAAMLAGLDPKDFATNDTWLSLMMAAHSASGGAADAEFIAWSVSDPSYADQEEAISLRWRSLDAEKPGGVTFHTLHEILRDHGAGHLIPAADATEDFDAIEADDEDAALPVPATGFEITPSHVAKDSFQNALTAVMKSPLTPAFDVIRENIVFRAEKLPWPDSFGRVLDDNTARLVRLYFVTRFAGVRFQPSREHVFEALVSLGYTAKFNPLLDWLDSLKWDGAPRVAGLFTEYFGAPDDDYTRAVSSAFLVGAVRRMRKPGSKFDTMPVLKGTQGTGKSSGVRILFGDEFFTDAELGALRDKDAALALRGKWCVEFSEIQSLSRAEVGTLKAFMSRQTDRLRDPFARVAADHPRRCVFVGTTNSGGYLKDDTGGRRFWPLDLHGEVRLKALARDREQLWAEAASMEAAGALNTLPRELWTVAAERQKAETSADPWVDLIAEFLRQRETAHVDAVDEFGQPVRALPPNRVHTWEVFQALNIREGEQSGERAQRLRSVMEQALDWKSAGVIRINGRPARGYRRRNTKPVLRAKGHD